MLNNEYLQIEIESYFMYSYILMFIKYFQNTYYFKIIMIIHHKLLGNKHSNKMVIYDTISVVMHIAANRISNEKSRKWFSGTYTIIRNYAGMPYCHVQYSIRTMKACSISSDFLLGCHKYIPYFTYKLNSWWG